MEKIKIIVCLLFITLFAFSISSCSQDNQNSQNETKSNDYFIQEILEFSEEDTGDIEYWVIISNEYNWNEQTFYAQGEFALEAFTSCLEKARENGYDKNVFVQGKLENEAMDMAFNAGTTSKEIGLWVDGKLKDKYKF